MLKSLSVTSAAISAQPALQRLPVVRLGQTGGLILGIKLAGAGLALVLQLALARALGHTGYGEFAYAFAWLQLMLIFAHGGFATAALRFVAEYRARCQLALLHGFLKRSTQIALIQSVLLALVLAGCAVAAARAESAGSVRNLLLASAALPILAQVALGSAILRGAGHAVSGMLVLLTHPVLLLFSLLATAVVFHKQISSSDALLLNLAASTGALGLVLTLRHRLGRELKGGQQRSYRTAEWLATATQLMVASSLIYVQGRTGIIFSGLLLDTHAAGTYAALERLADVALLGLVSVNLLAAPKFAALYAQRRRGELAQYAQWAAWGSTAFMLAVVVPLVLLGKPLLSLFGEPFAAGYPALLILLGGVGVNAACGPVGYLLSMTGHQRDTILVATATLGINVALSLLLIPRYGIVGTAIANAVAMSMWNIALLLVVRWRLGMWACIGRACNNTHG